MIEAAGLEWAQAYLTSRWEFADFQAVPNPKLVVAMLEVEQAIVCYTEWQIPKQGLATLYEVLY